MLFQFSPLIQAAVVTGKYAQVFSNGIPIGMVRDSVTGKFVAHAIGATVNGNPLSPLISPIQSIIKEQVWLKPYGFSRNLPRS